jgi:acetoin utilization protein AcuB
MNYILGKTKCEDIMETNIITSSKEALVEDVAVLIKENNISALPIIDENNKLEGIITDDDILGAFIEIVGKNDSGTRIALEAKNQVGVLADIAATISSYDMNITHVMDYYSQKHKESAEIIIRVNSLDTDELVKEFETKGYKVVSIVKTK